MRLKLLIFEAMLLPISALAADTTLVVERTNGTTASFALKDHPVLTMGGTQLKIVSDVIQTEFERTDVKQFYFLTNSTDIQQTKKDMVLFHQTDANHLEISGLPANESITVCDMGGQSIGTVRRTQDGAVVSFSNQQKGIYLIQVGKSQTNKFIKK
jgi:hypothetical protein